MKFSKNATIFLVLVSALVVQMMRPMVVRADGEVTPASTETPQVTETPVPTDVVPTETPTEAPTELVKIETPTASDSPTPDPVITETPIPTVSMEPLTEAPATELPVDDEERKTPTEAPQIETPTPEPTDVAATAEAKEESTTDAPADQTLLEVVAEIPGETDVMVLDENGEVLPLALQTTADVIAQSDPVWCPTGQTPGGAGCSAAFLTVTQLVSSIGSVSNGTIYFTASTYSTNDMTFFFESNLSIQGGWNGATGSAYDISGFTTFTVPIELLYSYGDINISNVIVESPYSSAGLYVETTGSVNITDSSFVNNPDYGAIVITGTNEDLTITNSHFDGNDVGLGTGFNTSINVLDSTFNNNHSLGMYVVSDTYYDPYNTPSTVHVVGSQFTGNPVDYAAYCWNSDGVLYVTQAFDDDPENPLVSFKADDPCTIGTVTLGSPPSLPDPPKQQPSTGGNITLSSGSDLSFFLECSPQRPSYTINLPNGDKVEIICPVNGKASITRMDNTTIPGPLPDGYTFASAFQLEILQVMQPPQREGNDFKRWSIPFIDEGGHVKVSFEAPSSGSGNNYSILYWDNGSWITLKDFLLNTNSLPESFSLDPGADPPDERIILSGVELIHQGEDSRVEVSTNFPGIFVLAQR